MRYGWGHVSGTITASKAERDYTVTVQARNKAGKGAPFTTTWHIEPFDSSIAGTYHAIIERTLAQMSSLTVWAAV